MTSIGSSSAANGFFQAQAAAKASQTDGKTSEDQSVAATSVKQKTAAEEFMEFAQMTPAEKMRALVLGEMGLTEDDLKAMSAEDRAKAEEKIAQRLREKMQHELEKQTGMSAPSGNLTSLLA